MHYFISDGYAAGDAPPNKNKSFEAENKIQYASMFFVTKKDAVSAAGGVGMPDDMVLPLKGKRNKADAGILILGTTLIPKDAGGYDTEASAHTSTSSHHTPGSYLSSSSSAVRFLASTCPSGNFVDCDNGKVRGNSTATCSAKCGTKCCVGSYACDYFTGKVCKDGSCSGENACKHANIALGVVTKSCTGKKACYSTGYNGTVGSIVDSCSGEYSCASIAEYEGMVRNISNSCNGTKACYAAGYIGTVGSISSSCKGENACDKAGYKGKVGNISNSCKGSISNPYSETDACYSVGSDGGKVGNVANSCLGFYACDTAGAGTNGGIAGILNSCMNNTACYAAGTGKNTSVAAGNIRLS